MADLNASLALQLTLEGLATLTQKKQEASLRNLNLLLEKTIKSACAEGYGSLIFKYHQLLDSERETLVKFGFKLKWMRSGDYGPAGGWSRLIWCKGSPKQQYVPDNNKAEERLEDLLR